MVTVETLYAPVSELAEQIRARKLSPVELTEAYLQRLETVGKRLNAVAYVMRETALKEAREAEAEIKRGRYRGPLHGIPYGAKDLCATREAPTTWGATPYKDQRFDYDATVVTRLREAGAVLVAKLSMIELAGGMGYNQADASWTGACRTPWNTGFWSGGSSSGPGAATASACVAFSIGSETSGSIITPAAFCGVSGLRPTYGAVSRHGAMALSWTLDKLGPMCRSALDAGLVLAGIAGRDPLDPTSRASEALPRYSKEGRLLNPRRERRLLRVGVLKDSYEKAQPEVNKNFLASLDVLRRFASVEMDVKMPDFPYGPAVGTIVDAEGASAFRDLIESGRVSELASPEGRVGGYARFARHGCGLPARDAHARADAPRVGRDVQEGGRRRRALALDGLVPRGQDLRPGVPRHRRHLTHRREQPRRRPGDLGAERLRAGRTADRHPVRRPGMG